LIELLVVVVVISVLATLVLPLTELARLRAKEEDLRGALREIRTAIDRYKDAYDVGRIERTVDGSGYPPDLQTLVVGVTDIKSPTGGRLVFLRRLPLDPFAQGDATQGADKNWGLRSYESTADEPQPGKDVFDVYSTSGKVGSDGRPYRVW
jgi:general secretion pathway protein G